MEQIRAFADRLSPYAPAVLRVAIGLVFVYFGWTSISAPDTFAKLVPEWMGAIAAAESLVRAHGVVEILLGLALAANIWPRAVAFVLFLDLAHIVSLLNWGLTSVRDLGLAAAALSVALTRPRSVPVPERVA